MLEIDLLRCAEPLQIKGDRCLKHVTPDFCLVGTDIDTWEIRTVRILKNEVNGREAWKFTLPPATQKWT